MPPWNPSSPPFARLGSTAEHGQERPPKHDARQQNFIAARAIALQGPSCPDPDSASQPDADGAATSRTGERSDRAATPPSSGRPASEGGPADAVREQMEKAGLDPKSPELEPVLTAFARIKADPKKPLVWSESGKAMVAATQAHIKNQLTGVRDQIVPALAGVFKKQCQDATEDDRALAIARRVFDRVLASATAIGGFELETSPASVIDVAMPQNMNEVFGGVTTGSPNRLSIIQDMKPVLFIALRSSLENGRKRWASLAVVREKMVPSREDEETRALAATYRDALSTELKGNVAQFFGVIGDRYREHLAQGAQGRASDADAADAFRENARADLERLFVDAVSKWRLGKTPEALTLVAVDDFTAARHFPALDAVLADAAKAYQKSLARAPAVLASLTAAQAELLLARDFHHLDQNARQGAETARRLLEVPTLRGAVGRSENEIATLIAESGWVPTGEDCRALAATEPKATVEARVLEAEVKLREKLAGRAMTVDEVQPPKVNSLMRMLKIKKSNGGAIFESVLGSANLATLNEVLAKAEGEPGANVKLLASVRARRDLLAGA